MPRLVYGPWLLLMLGLWLATAGAEEAAQLGTLMPAPQRNEVPGWARPGALRYARCDGGPLEVCKAYLSGWEAIRTPPAVAACADFYGQGTIDRLRQAHINVAWVTWSPGFSPASEAGQQEVLRGWIARCRQAGIRVTAYISLTNMFVDDMQAQLPESREWVQVDALGHPRPYSAAKYDGKPTRLLACVNHPAWREHAHRTIAGAVAAGVDGITYDNCMHNCYCAICRKKFAADTRRFYGRSLPPPGTPAGDTAASSQGAEAATIADAPQLAGRAWQQFCRQALADALTDRRRFADSLRPGILVYANAHQVPGASEGLNALYTEDGVEPGMHDGRLSSNITLYRYLYAEGDGWKSIRIEHGKRLHGDRMFNPMPPRNQALAVYESAACQGTLASFFEMGWTTLLSLGDRPAQESLSALAAANRWLSDNQGLFAESEPIAQTAVVVPAVAPLTDLVAAGKNFIILLPKQLTLAQLSRFSLVILRDVRFMTNAQAEAVRQYVATGGRLIAAGPTANADAESLRELAQPRLDSLWTLKEETPKKTPGEIPLSLQERAGARGVRANVSTGLTTAPRVIHFPQVPQTGELLRAWEELEGKPPVAVRADSPGVCFQLTRRFDGRQTLLYLLNYGDAPAGNVTVTLRLPQPVKTLRLHQPGATARDVLPRNGPDGCHVVIPQVDTLAVLVAEH